MQNSSDATRRRIFEAARVEFAERGPDATSMTSIAARAGINRERLYAYYGDRHSLFLAVLSDAAEQLSAAVAPDGFGADVDWGRVAGETFDYYGAHPELARLMQWEGLSRSAPVSQSVRRDHYERKVRAVRDLQAAGAMDDAVEGPYFVFLIMASAAWWFAVPQLAALVTGNDAKADGEMARRRAAVVAAARRLAGSDGPTVPDGADPSWREGKA